MFCILQIVSAQFPITKHCVLINKFAWLVIPHTLAKLLAWVNIFARLSYLISSHRNRKRAPRLLFCGDTNVFEIRYYPNTTWVYIQLQACSQGVSHIAGAGATVIAPIVYAKGIKFIFACAVSIVSDHIYVCVIWANIGFSVRGGFVFVYIDRVQRVKHDLVGAICVIGWCFWRATHLEFALVFVFGVFEGIM